MRHQFESEETRPTSAEETLRMGLDVQLFQGSFDFFSELPARHLQPLRPSFTRPSGRMVKRMVFWGIEMADGAAISGGDRRMLLLNTGLLQDESVADQRLQTLHQGILQLLQSCSGLIAHEISPSCSRDTKASTISA